MAAKIPAHNYHSYDDRFLLPRQPSQLGDHSSATLVPLMTYDANSPVSVTSFPDHQFIERAAEMAGFCDYQWQLPITGGRLVPDLTWPPADYNPAEATDHFGIVQGKACGRKSEEDQTSTEVKVGRYSVEERKDRILRYLKKRNQRNFNKTIKYACRKTLADKRVRVRGRFAKNNEISEEDMAMSSTTTTHHHTFHSISQDSYQMTNDDDDWLQTAVANLVHLPYLGS